MCVCVYAYICVCLLLFTDLWTHRHTQHTPIAIHLLLKVHWKVAFHPDQSKAYSLSSAAAVRAVPTHPWDKNIACRGCLPGLRVSSVYFSSFLVPHQYVSVSPLSSLSFAFSTCVFRASASCCVYVCCFISSLSYPAMLLFTLWVPRHAAL